MSLGEHIFNLLQCPPSGLGETEEHVDECGKVESSEDEIGLPRDVGETRGDGPSQSEIKHPSSGLSRDAGNKEQSHLPVCGSRERNGLGTNPHRENLSRVGPGHGSHGDCEGADEEVRTYDDTFGDRIVAVDNPDTGTIDEAPFAETALKSADEVQPEAHHHGTNQQKRSATPLVNIDDSGDWENTELKCDEGRLLAKLTRENNVQDVLNGGSNQISATTSQTSTLENIDNIVPSRF